MWNIRALTLCSIVLMIGCAQQNVETRKATKAAPSASSRLPSKPQQTPAPTVVTATSVTLAWNANSEPDIAGYRLHYGFSHATYTLVQEAGNNATATVNNLMSGTQYFFVATAYNTGGIEGGFSNEVAVATAGPSPTPTVLPTPSPIPTVSPTPPSGTGILPVPSEVIFYAVPNQTPPQEVVITTSNGEDWTSDDHGTWMDAQPHLQPTLSGKKLTIRMTNIPPIGSSVAITLTAPGLNPKTLMVSYQAPVQTTPTPSPTKTPSPSPTISPTASPSPSPSPTRTPTPSPTRTPAPMPTASPTRSPSPSPTRTPTPPSSPSPSPTSTASPSPTPIAVQGQVIWCGSGSPMQNVTIMISGDVSGTTLTDTDGLFRFLVPPEASYVISASKPALPPASQAINTADMIALTGYFLGKNGLKCEPAGDVNGDARINTVDVVAVQRFSLGYSTSTAFVGQYRFVQEDGSLNFIGALIGDVQ